MLINNIDISTLGIELYDRTLSSNEVKTASEWLDGDIQPTFIRQQDNFKTLSLTFLILGQDEEDAFKRISRLTQLLRKAEIKFDDMNLLFKATMSGSATPKRLSNGNFVITYKLKSDYAMGDREIYTTNANATNSFKLTILYYKDNTTLLATDSITIRSASFNDKDITLSALGIDLNKYLPEYYVDGVATNLTKSLTYETLLDLKTLIINYTPIRYAIKVEYTMDSEGNGLYEEILEDQISFTYPQLSRLTSINGLINAKRYKPEGYSARIDYNGLLTVEDIVRSSPIQVLFTKVFGELSKNITVSYMKETDEGQYETLQASIVNVKSADFIGGETLKDFINVNAFRPSNLTYLEGVLSEGSLNSTITYDEVETAYTIYYNRAVNNVYVEYYVGVYPDWHRLTTNTVAIKYKDSYASNFDINAIGLNINKYASATYLDGKILNASSYANYEDLINAGIIQVYYEPINFNITVNYSLDGRSDLLGTETIKINELMFLNAPLLGDIINLTKYRPEGYQLSTELSYRGDLTLQALTQASPISIIYEEIVANRTKNILVRYKQELASTYTTINSSIITISEADCVGGVRLKDIITLDAYKPDYYTSGIIDNHSDAMVYSYDGLESSYDVLYLAEKYLLPVRYYKSSVADLNWIGSSTIEYSVISFSTTSTLYDFGLNLNAYKPSTAKEGQIQYNGPINFSSLRALESIDIVYPEDEEEIGGEGVYEYPHRFLFLEHNDLGQYEGAHPNWSFPHAYINTGVAVEDMSKLTVVMECDRVDDLVPLHEVNAGYGYLFGSSGPSGSYFMRYNNQTSYGTGLTGVNTYEAHVGKSTAVFSQAEETALGFSTNTGIYATETPGRSYATFTYTNNIQNERGALTYPLYLFANNVGNEYQDGLAGIGIYGCRIYYDGQLIRDMIPVQFFDKIGDKIAPSNCLYDKITGSFFEDATGKNSFNIRDDNRYIDTNPDHHIGQCYVNYYKDGEMFQSSTVLFRESDFLKEIAWDPYEMLDVEGVQPNYCKAGIITNLAELKSFTYSYVNNFVFKVNYESLDTFITVNYYKDDTSEANLIKSEIIPLTEKDFYQVPTFGDLVRLNKYKPNKYKTDFKYTGKRVSLARVLEDSPYNIVYVPETEEIQTYTTQVKYIRKVFGIRTYETLDVVDITLDSTDFRDGEYIDYHIDMNLKKPAKYYLDGEFYEGYSFDEKIDSPEKLKSQYTVVYQPDTVGIDINYYRDTVDEDHLVASAVWNIKIDDFDEAETFSLVDMLDNDFINRYRPVGCNGGRLQNPEVDYTFVSLVEKGSIEIIYESLLEPHDPESADFPKQVLIMNTGSLTHSYDARGLAKGTASGPDCYGYHSGSSGDESMEDAFHGGRIPYIDLGYTPKELARLRVEIQASAESNDLSGWSDEKGSIPYTNDYLAYFGYVGAGKGSVVNKYYRDGRIYEANAICPNGNYAQVADYWANSKGNFAVRTRAPVPTYWMYRASGPANVDGITTLSSSDDWDNANALYQWHHRYQGVYALFRRGNQYDWNDDYEVFQAHRNFQLGVTEELDTRANREGYGVRHIFNPYTVIMDAYNGYISISSVGLDEPLEMVCDYSKEIDTFENREKPRGSLTLFQTRNPYTGEMNIMPWRLITYPSMNSAWMPGALSSQLVGAGLTDAFSAERVATLTTTTKTLITQDNGDGTTSQAWDIKTTTRQVNYLGFQLAYFPQVCQCAVWGIKIWDRDRLVRDLIPVKKDQKIYDYTMPENGLFDLITEIFFGNANFGGTYTTDTYFPAPARAEGMTYLSKQRMSRTITPDQVYPLLVSDDPLTYGKITVNYYNYDNTFLGNQFVDVPIWYNTHNNSLEDILRFNDFKPNDYVLDGLVDVDRDLENLPSDNNWIKNMTLKEIYELGSVNVFYKLKTYTKTIVFYNEDTRIGSRDLFFNLKDIEDATSISEIMEKAGVSPTEFLTDDYGAYQFIFDDKVIEDNDIEAFIDAPSPVVRYLQKDNATEDEKRLYLNYYRGGASDETNVRPDPNSENYLICDLEASVLNPLGAIKYLHHYHSALYEDEVYDYFIPYQVNILNKYVGIHYGPALRYKTLAMIITNERYTIVEERNGWGRLKEYRHGWIRLSATEKVVGPGQNPDYDVPTEEQTVIPFTTRLKITRLTNDRLWAYATDYNSWIKCEDISFDQAGKYLQGLGSEVIHLNNIDWSSVKNITDLGVKPEAYRLRFHDRSNYSYNGDYTLDAFSRLQSIDFVYPETVYTYNCQYRTIPNGNILGNVAFSCAIGDWNIDWDKFIETSWKYDDEGNALNPQLYRSNEDLVLTWDYFGLDRNLYKPNENYEDGIYTWNPYGWDKDNKYFTFRQLIATGSQTVVYHKKFPEYQLMFSRDIYDGKEYRLSSTGKIQQHIIEKTRDYWIDSQTLAPSYPLTSLTYNISNIIDYKIHLPENLSFYLEAGVIERPIGMISAPSDTMYDGYVFDYNSIIPGRFEQQAIKIADNQSHTMWSPIVNGTSGIINTLSVTLDEQDKGTVICEFYNFIDNYTVQGLTNYITGQKPRYFYSTRINNPNKESSTKYATVVNWMDLPPYGVNHPEDSLRWHPESSKYNYFNNYITMTPNSILYGLKVYDRNVLIADFVPVPANYRMNGYRFKYNSLYDKLSGQVAYITEKEDPYNVVRFTHIFPKNKYATLGNISTEIDLFKTWKFSSQTISAVMETKNLAFGYQYPSTDSKAIRTLQPGNLVIATRYTSEDNDSDIEGNWYYIGGAWFQNPADAPVLQRYSAGKIDTTKVKVENGYTNVVIVAKEQNEPTDNGRYYKCPPGSLATVSNVTIPDRKPLQESPVTGKEYPVYGSYTDDNNVIWLWLGFIWIKRIFTNLDTEVVNKNYVIVNDTPYYDRPTEKDEYKITNYLYGERITINKKIIDTEWYYTGNGWIHGASNITEVG